VQYLGLLFFEPRVPFDPSTGQGPKAQGPETRGRCWAIVPRVRDLRERGLREWCRSMARAI